MAAELARLGNPSPERLFATLEEMTLAARLSGEWADCLAECAPGTSGLGARPG
jgi:hypothetical protein